MRLARPLLLGLLLAAPSLGDAQQIRIRRVVTPPPTTFAGLQRQQGSLPTGPCDFPAVTLDLATLTPTALADSGTLRLPPDWSRIPLFEGEDEYTASRLLAPGESRVLIRRRRNGSAGRAFTMYRNGERPTGSTCLVDRGTIGAIWTFYAPDPDVHDSPRPFLAFGDIMTPEGRWYGIMLSSVSPEERSRASAMFTELALLDPVYSPTLCPRCTAWNTPADPVPLFGNTWFVGTHGLSSILITSDSGHILLDGALPESAPVIMAHVRALGFRVEDIRLIVNSHPHFDHAGGIAAIRRASGARVAASPGAAPVLRAGRSGTDDPQYGLALAYPAVDSVREIAEGDTLRVGPLAVVAHFTPGHTPGGTSWSWRTCDGDSCLDFVYADSQTPVSADSFFFTRSTTYPTAIADFEHGLTVLENLSCDVLLTPHPEASGLWDRLSALRLRGPGACRRYAHDARESLARRLERESKRP